MPTVEQTIAFGYSAFGERISKTTPSATTTYVGDDYRRVQPSTATSTEPTLHHYRIFLSSRQIAQVTRSEQDGAPAGL